MPSYGIDFFTISQHAGESVLVETLIEASSTGRVEISCLDGEPYQFAFRAIKECWVSISTSARYGILNISAEY
jgi:hypothetical protein